MSLITLKEQQDLNNIFNQLVGILGYKPNTLASLGFGDILSQVGSSASGYDTIKNQGVAVTQRTTFNFSSTEIVATDNSGSTRTDIALGSTLASKTLSSPTLSGTVSGTPTWASAQTFPSPMTVGNLVLSHTGLTAARTFTFPDTTDTVVTLGASQVLTNKSLTSPTLTGTVQIGSGLTAFESHGRLAFPSGTSANATPTIELRGTGGYQPFAIYASASGNWILAETAGAGFFFDNTNLSSGVTFRINGSVAPYNFLSLVAAVAPLKATQADSGSAPALILKQGSSPSVGALSITNSSDAPLWAFDAAGIPQWANASNVQTTVGSAGAAAALPATPSKYLKVKSSDGTTYIVPAYDVV